MIVKSPVAMASLLTQLTWANTSTDILLFIPPRIYKHIQNIRNSRTPGQLKACSKTVVLEVRINKG
jgi:hypothetical protein